MIVHGTARDNVHFCLEGKGSDFDLDTDDDFAKGRPTTLLVASSRQTTSLAASGDILHKYLQEIHFHGDTAICNRGPAGASSQREHADQGTLVIADSHYCTNHTHRTRAKLSPWAPSVPDVL